MTKKNLEPQDIADVVSTWNLEMFHAIYGIPVSGMIPTFILAGMTGMPMVLQWEHLIKMLEDGQQVLLIDDVKDSGKTEKKIKKLLSKYKDQIEFKYIVDKSKQKKANREWVETFWEADKAIFHDEDDVKTRKAQKNGDTK